MLARNAEALYWIGRYVERADDTARILDVAVHQLLEDSSVDPDQASRLLLRVLGIEPPNHRLDVWSLTDLVAFRTNAEGGCSIVDAISAARENARSAREVISSETWECINTTYHGLPERERAAKRLGPHEFCRSSKVGRRCSRAWRIPHSPVTTDTDSWCWAGRSSEST